MARILAIVCGLMILGNLSQSLPNGGLGYFPKIGSRFENMHLQTRSDTTKFGWISMNSVFAENFAEMATEQIQVGDKTLLHIDLAKIQDFVGAVIMSGVSPQGGGYVVHTQGKEDGLKYLEDLETGVDKSYFDAPTMDNEQVAEILRDSVDAEKMMQFGESLLEKFDTRYAKSTGAAKVSNWLRKKMKRVIQSRNDITVKSISDGKTNQKSIVVTIEGSEPGIVILGAHLDSISGTWEEMDLRPESAAPGADDDGSGLIVLMEALRVIVETGYKPAKTVEIHAYGAEEIGLLGSEAIAAEYEKDNKNVVGMLGFDMVGHKGDGAMPYNFAVSKDYSNQDHADFVANLIVKYLSDNPTMLPIGIPIQPYLFFTCGYVECSDHGSFFLHGFPGNFMSEPNKTPNYHTEKDKHDDLDKDQMANNAKLALVYLAELAKGST